MARPAGERCRRRPRPPRRASCLRCPGRPRRRPCAAARVLAWSRAAAQGRRRGRPGHLRHDARRGGRGRRRHRSPAGRAVRLWGLPLVGHGDSGLYTFCRWLAVPLFGGLYRCRATGAENLPREGAVIVIINHKANIDPVIVGMICDRPLRYMAKRELFGNAALRKLIVTLGAFPIDRGAGGRAALTTSLEILAEGGVLLMFPEGHRKPDDAVHEFLPGVGMLALRSGAPVVPLRKASMP